ncbi:MAG: hypothetical protein A2270_05850 [Elusimicrobia bacterium RIFOXYA12_FULL_51_18]|nr:MAG: hypothetical protein A2270_05850 [Elusimicrobia bacterium RIFOXYA12_FULL_51_18]OGS29670.1 MAG: hypothetical protein A2218_03130 [Elusimicrobia bacterium RIFOXYA2_FULL_53_38]
MSGQVFSAGVPIPLPASGITLTSSGELYLARSQDPGFLETLAKFSVVAYKRGRTLIVRLTSDYASLPADIKSGLRIVTMDEVYNAPAGFKVSEASRPEVRALLAKVSGVQLKNYAETLVYAGKRSAAQLDLKNGSGNKLAMDAVAGFFKGLGLKVERNCYKVRKFDKECNIIGSRAGASPGSRIILVIGHMDSVGYENAGADDNASGAAGVLEMARVLAGYNSDHAFVFVAANGEENGIIGGYACAEELRKNGLMSRLAWVINMDMISWNKDGVVELETNKEYLEHAEWVSALATTYTTLKPHIATPAWGSDHVPFLEAGIPTYLSIEHWEAHNPCYHKACDTLDVLSWGYASEIVKLNLAVVAGKAGLTPIDIKLGER